MATTPSRSMARMLGTYHNVTYYARELRVFRERGIEKFWHSYMAYRAAPMGEVQADVVTATFYNFAPSLVEAAVPAVWKHVTAAQAIDLRANAMATALTNALGTDVDETAVAIADTVIDAMAELPAAGRALFGAYRALPRPELPVMQLWHATTLWREFRGDGHNIALAAEGIDGIECHVLLAGRGIASQEIIEKIRGWSSQHWQAAHERLVGRGLVAPDGVLTNEGTLLRRHIEDLTDKLAHAPLDLIGPDRTTAILNQMDPIVSTLVSSGVVAGKWPPPADKMATA